MNITTKHRSIAVICGMNNATRQQESCCHGPDFGPRDGRRERRAGIGIVRGRIEFDQEIIPGAGEDDDPVVHVSADIVEGHAELVMDAAGMRCPPGLPALAWTRISSTPASSRSKMDLFIFVAIVVEADHRFLLHAAPGATQGPARS